MADRPPPRPAPTSSTNGTQFLQRITSNAPTLTQLISFLALIITAGTFLLIAGIAAAAIAVGLVLFAPLIILTSPIWVLIGIALFLLVAGFLTLCGLGLAAVAVGSWLYMYLRGLQPPGSNRVDYARSRIADTASHVKDYAWEYGGYLQSKVKDAAPGA